MAGPGPGAAPRPSSSVEARGGGAPPRAGGHGGPGWWAARAEARSRVGAGGQTLGWVRSGGTQGRGHLPNLPACPISYGKMGYGPPSTVGESEAKRETWPSAQAPQSTRAPGSRLSCAQIWGFSWTPCQHPLLGGRRHGAGRGVGRGQLTRLTMAAAALGWERRVQPAAGLEAVDLEAARLQVPFIPPATPGENSEPLPPGEVPGCASSSPPGGPHCPSSLPGAGHAHPHPPFPPPPRGCLANGATKPLRAVSAAWRWEWGSWGSSLVHTAVWNSSGWFPRLWTRGWPVFYIFIPGACLQLAGRAVQKRLRELGAGQRLQAWGWVSEDVLNTTPLWQPEMR